MIQHINANLAQCQNNGLRGKQIRIGSRRQTGRMVMRQHNTGTLAGNGIPQQLMGIKLHAVGNARCNVNFFERDIIVIHGDHIKLFPLGVVEQRADILTAHLSVAQLNRVFLVLLDLVKAGNIPEGMQGRVYAVRNALQFFTIPVGYVLGGALVDAVFRPLMRNPLPWLEMLFGRDEGNGAACFYAALALMGVLTCLFFQSRKSLKALEGDKAA